MLRFLLIKNSILLLILLLVSFPSRGGVNEDWERARKANTAQAIATFLENHPGSRFSKDAEAALQRARYDFATRSSDARALEAYIKIYPTGEDAERVKVLLQALHPVQKDGLASEPTPIQATKPVIAINISEMSPWWIAAALLTAIIGYVIIRRLSHGSDKFSTTQTPIAESSSITISAIPAPQQPSLGNANTAQAAILRDKLDLPPEFDTKMSYREMFQSLSRDRLLEMCAELPVEALDLDNPGRAPTARKMGRAITQVFAVGTYMAMKDVPREYGDILFPRMVSKIQSYNGSTLHLELCDLIRDFAIHLGTSGRHADAVRVMRTLKASLFWKTWQQGNFCLFASLNNIAQETKLAVDFEAALVAAQGLPTDQFQQVEAVVKKLQQDMPKAQGQDAQPTDRPTYKVLAVSDQHDIRKWPILNSPNKAVNPPGERATREAGDVQPPANATPIPPSEVKLASNAEMHARQLIFRYPKGNCAGPKFGTLMLPGDMGLAVNLQTHGASFIKMSGERDPYFLVRCDKDLDQFRTCALVLAYSFCRFSAGGMVFIFIGVELPGEDTPKGGLIETCIPLDSGIEGQVELMEKGFQMERLHACFAKGGKSDGTIVGPDGSTHRYKIPDCQFDRILAIPRQAAAVLATEYKALREYHATISPSIRNLQACMNESNEAFPQGQHPVIGYRFV